MNLAEGVNIKSLVLAGFIAGYVMYVVDLALDGWFGLFGTYRIYRQWLVDAGLFPGLEDIALFIGHQLNGILFGFLFAYPPVYRLLPGNPLVKGIIFGNIWHILVLLVSFLFGKTGAIWLNGLLTMSVEAHISLYLLHIIWSTTLAVFYKPVHVHGR
ncbi:hypothetical protein [Persephonella sp.]